MTYAIRNSLILFGLLILIFFVMFFNNQRALKVLHKVALEKDNKAGELMRLRKDYPDLANEKQIIAKHQKMLEEAAKKTKRILKIDNPTITYDYLIKLSKKYAKNLSFNFLTLESGKVNETFYNSYNITGDASIYSIAKFIYQLEKQPPLYTIEKFKLLENENGSIYSDSLHFDMELKVYFDFNGTDIKDITLLRLPKYYLKENPFRFKIHEPQKTKESEFDIDLDKAKLIAITKDMIFLKVEGQYVRALRTGDMVAYGYLDKIDFNNQLAVFKINKIGLPQKKILKIEKD